MSNTSRSGKNVPLKDYLGFLDNVKARDSHSFVQNTMQLYDASEESTVIQMATQKYRCFPLLVKMVSTLQLKGYWPLQVALTKETCFDKVWQRLAEYIRHRSEHPSEANSAYTKFVDALDELWQSHLEADPQSFLERSTNAKRKMIDGNMMLVEGLLEGEEDRDWELADIDSQSTSYKAMNDCKLVLRADLSDVDACLTPGYRFDTLTLFHFEGTVHLWSRTGSKVHLLEICAYALGPAKRKRDIL